MKPDMLPESAKFYLLIPSGYFCDTKKIVLLNYVADSNDNVLILADNVLSDSAAIVVAYVVVVCSLLTVRKMLNEPLV
jgi:hypothetical protein